MPNICWFQLVKWEYSLRCKLNTLMFGTVIPISPFYYDFLKLLIPMNWDNCKKIILHQFWKFANHLVPKSLITCKQKNKKKVFFFKFFLIVNWILDGYGLLGGINKQCENFSLLNKQWMINWENIWHISFILINNQLINKDSRTARLWQKSYLRLFCSTLRSRLFNAVTLETLHFLKHFPWTL